MEDTGKVLNASKEGDESNPPFRRALTARNKAIVVLFIDTGIRLRELVGLRLGDLDLRVRLNDSFMAIASNYQDPFSRHINRRALNIGLL